jgi:hypothetical protein
MSRVGRLSGLSLIFGGGALLALALLLAGGGSRASAAPSGGSLTISGTTREISTSGTSSFLAGVGTGTAAGIQNPEILGPSDAVQAPDRSHSSGGTSVGAVTQPKNVTNSDPGLLASFGGLDHFDQRFGSGGGNQYSLEPPDQGLCVGSDGNGHRRVLEVVNDVMRVYDTSGAPVTSPTALNGFLGYAPAIIRSSLTFGPFVTDPSCLYDAATGRWFLDVLTLDVFPHVGSDGNSHYTGTNHLDLAVSNTSDPAGTWTIYHIPAQDDGTDGTPNHGCSAGPPGTDGGEPPTNPNACFGDYPHIGSDANGIYLTTNEYSFFGSEFHGAQIYAFSKAQLAAAAPTLNVTQFNTQGMDPFGFALNGFTLWPSTTPGGGGDGTANGTEYFMSSNAAAEAHDTGNGLSTAEPSTQLLVWAITDTSSLAGTPALSLSVTKLDVGLYSPPPSAEQKAGPQPLRDCLNNNRCSVLLEGIKDPFTETASHIDANDSRMQQVTWVGGKLWGALDTALSISNGKQAGIEWFEAAPSTATGSITASLANEGYMGLGNDNLTYPAIGVTSGGTGVMAFTVVGNDYYPSAGYATVSGSGVGAVHVAAPGAGPDDGFSDYKLFGNPPGTIRPRWGDYGAAVPVGSNVWIASEYIGQSCSLGTYLQTAFRCNNTRTALANWDTRISEVAAP